MEFLQVLDVSHVSEPTAKAFALAHNRVGEMSEWDFPVLADELQKLGEELRSAAGFDLGEVEAVFSAAWSAKNGQPGFVRIGVSKAQAATIDAALALIRKEETDAEMSEGRALELIAADYMAGQ